MWGWVLELLADGARQAHQKAMWSLIGIGKALYIGVVASLRRSLIPAKNLGFARSKDFIFQPQLLQVMPSMFLYGLKFLAGEKNQLGPIILRLRPYNLTSRNIGLIAPASALLRATWSALGGMVTTRLHFPCKCLIFMKLYRTKSPLLQK
jgi:hypothetical protein